MSFAILGANAALVPNCVRTAKSVNNTRVSTVTVAVRPEFPALDAIRSQSQYNHVSHARYLDRLVSVPLAALETRVSTEDPVRFSRSAQRKTDVAVRFPSFPFLGDWWFTTRNRPKKPSLRKSDPRGRGERTPGAKWRRRMTTDPISRTRATLQISDDKTNRARARVTVAIRTTRTRTWRSSTRSTSPAMTT